MGGGWLGAAGWAIVWPPAWTCGMCLLRYLLRGGWRWDWAQYALQAAAAAIGGASSGSSAQVAVGAGQFAFGLWMWWRNRRRRDWVPRAYGAKSKALLADLVRKAREAAAPRPMPSPA